MTANDNAARILSANEDPVTVGLVPQGDGTFLALTLSESKTFKTRSGAERWLAGRGYAPNGDKLAQAATTAAREGARLPRGAVRVKW